MKSIHLVAGAGIRTHNLYILGHLEEPLDHWQILKSSKILNYHVSFN